MRPARRARGPLTLLVAIVASVSATVALDPALAATGDPGYRQHDYADGQAMSILPPGENGLVNATDAAQFEATGTRPQYSQDQLGKYEGLLYGYHGLTNAHLSDFYDDESFGIAPGNVTSTISPESGVTIYRDNHGVPHIYGQTDAAAAFGSGYAQAQDRLFLMDVLRHYGSGTLASFLGSSCAFEQMDHDQLLLAPYTNAQANAQINRMAANNGAAGRLAKTMIENYVAGVNAYITATQTNPSLLPADYAAAAAPPQPWTAADVVNIAGLIGGIFGKGGGTEVAQAHLLQFLRGKYGARAGLAAFHNIDHQDDRLAPTTITDKVFPYDKRTARLDPSLTALPDRKAPVTGGPQSTSASCNTTPSNPTALNIIKGLQALPKAMSNALVVNGNRSATGHPVAVFGPQVSYFAPQILAEEEIQAPHYSAEGASFPGTGLVELGRGQDYAWSATSAGSDLIDQRIERICNPAGGKPAANGTSYHFRGKCVPMRTEHFTETVYPKPGGQGQPDMIDHVIHLTRHGVLQGWTRVRGRPVAIVNQRSTYNHDIDSVVGFLDFANPDYVHNVGDWMRAANKIVYTFNWFYADSRDTGYFSSGLLPLRNPHEDTSLPTWGTGSAEWRGFLGINGHPHETNPKQGFFVSWNNKPAPGVANDSDYNYGQTFRSTMLVTQLRHQLAHGRVTRAEVVQAMETAASQDLDGLTVMPLLLRYVGSHHEPAGVRAMIAQLRTWVASGAHRLKAATGDSQYQHAPAVAISDVVMNNLVRALYNRILLSGGTSGVGSTGGAATPGYAVVPMQWVNTPNSGGAHLGSAYDGGYEGYVMSTMQQLLGRHPRDGFGPTLTRHECRGGPSTCRTAIDAALLTSYQQLANANGSSDVASWTVTPEAKAASQTMPQFDAIAFKALGIVGQPNIDWQNRPTFQQVIQFPRHR